jgi:hypothetical protein
MEEKLDEVLRGLASVQDALKKRPPTISDRLLFVMEKALVPLSVAAIAVFGNLAAIKISEGQLALAQSAAEDRKAEFRRTMQGRYLEILYRDITSTDPRQQATALGVLKLLDPSLANDVAKFVASNSQIAPQLKAEVETETERLRAAALAPTTGSGTDVLAGLAIGIYYLAADQRASLVARDIHQHLKSKLLANSIRLYPSTPEFLQYAYPTQVLEVRYEEGIENKQA